MVNSSCPFQCRKYFENTQTLHILYGASKKVQRSFDRYFIHDFCRVDHLTVTLYMICVDYLTVTLCMISVVLII
jgi:hypothetical protein